MNLSRTTINGEEIFLKKSWTGWAVVEPIIDPDTKKFVWKNFLSKKGFVVLAFLLLLLGFSYLAMKEQIGNYERVMKEPCAFCEDCQEYSRQMITQFKREAAIPDTKLNFTIIE